MIPRVAPTGSLTGTCFSGPGPSGPYPLFFLRLAVALVLFALPAAALKAQEPEQWPQDDDYPPQQADAGGPQYSQPQPYDSGQSGAQQGYYGAQPGQQPAYGQQ